jgi:AAA15 family ATPase/GTPase
MAKMIDSIDIRKYRNLDELRINSLARANLIIGKNNAGKSTLLEAIALFVTKCNLGIIFQILEERGEFFSRIPNNKNATEANVKSLSSLFANRNVGFEKSDAITIGTIENNLIGDQNSVGNSVALRFVKYYDEIISEIDNTEKRSKRTAIENVNNKILGDYKLGLEIRIENNSFILSLDDERVFNRLGFISVGGIENFQFISTRSIDREINGKLWDYIILTEKEQFVIEALRIIEPLVERIAFIEEGRGYRSVVVKLSNNNNVFPLRNMGDGINRIFTIILALVNSENGYLLIDEFENGLHHSVQEKLWEIIFNLANKLNIQIFATTHSEDCISGFQNILNSTKNNLDGKLIRLDNINGKIKEVEFNKEELKIATDQNIEIR